MSRPISELLALIQSAVYGKDVRGAIHDSIEQCYSDVSTSSTAADNAASAANSAATAASNAAANAESAATAANIAAAEASQYSEELAQKANIDGYYEELTSGSAEQLLSSKFTEDAVPYVYRKTGGSIDVGNRKMEQIVGGSIVWNQLVQVTASSTTQNGVTITANADGSVTFNGTATENVLFNAYPVSAITTGHVILIAGCPSGGSTASYFLADGYGSGAYDIGRGKVYKTFGTQTSTIAQHRIQSGTVCDNLVFKPQIFDLTKMFGETIAEYVLSLDTANSGAGLTWFRAMFPNSIYAYNEGELTSVHTTQHETVGFNQWDEEWEEGRFDTDTGANVNGGVSDSQIRSKNYIPVIPGVRYYFNTSDSSAWTMFFDENKNPVDPPVLGGTMSSGRCIAFTNRTFTVPSNARYIRFYVTQSYGGTYKNDICLNVSWTGYRNGEYEPYAKHVYALDDDLTLLGIPKLDANNHIYYDGDTYEADGTVTRRAVEVEVTSCNSAGTATTGAKYVAFLVASLRLPTPINESTANNFLSDKYAYRTSAPSDGDKWFRIMGPVIYIFDERFTDKTTADGILASEKPHFVYITTTPTTEQATPYTNPQIVDDFGTERFVDTRSVAVPVGHSTKYMSNLRDKLQHLPDLAASDGDYMIHQANGQMTLTPSSLPAAPSQNGNYILKCTVSNGAPTYSWEAQS